VTQRRSARARTKNGGSSAAFQSAASRPQTGRCADATECSGGRAAPFRSFGSVDSNAIVRSKYAARGPSHPGPRATKRRSLRFLMLNSARRHCISPRRGRRVEWSDQGPGIVRLHFRPRRFCRRCACDASYDSVGNAGSINETTTDKPLVIDSV